MKDEIIDFFSHFSLPVYVRHRKEGLNVNHAMFINLGIFPSVYEKDVVLQL